MSSKVAYCHYISLNPSSPCHQLETNEQLQNQVSKMDIKPKFLDFTFLV